VTESACALCCSHQDDATLGHCGPPVTCAEVRVVDVPEMGYYANQQQGEVQVRGPSVFSGYFKNPEGSAEVLDEKDGWFSTGDIGRWNANGTLSIVDRKKNIFKLCNGEYVAPEKLEQVYSRCPYIGQIWVYGNSFKNFCVAVIAPSPDEIIKTCKESNWWPEDYGLRPGSPEFLESIHNVLTGEHAKELKDKILTSLSELNTQLKKFEQLRGIIIEPRLDENLAGFTEKNQCLTPTFKLRRQALLNRYHGQLKELYDSLGEPDKKGEVCWPERSSTTL